MKHSGINAQDAASNSTEHRFPWEWYLSDIGKKEKSRGKVFSCFSCGGGSSMGYKLAGYEVVGNCEIDPRVNEVYKKNNRPKYNFMMDIRDFLGIKNENLPEELFNLDILDGSPPCSTFSVCGGREKGWGKKKVFREGQAAQRLDDLFFWFIKAAEKLKPKVVVAENVKGLLMGNAKGYVNEIIKGYNDAGYTVQIFLLDASSMGVPQKRERVFFIAHRKELCFPKLKLKFNESKIHFSEVKSGKGEEVHGEKTLCYISKMRRSDKDFGDIAERETGKRSSFSTKIIWDNEVPNTIVSGSNFLRGDDKTWLSDKDYQRIQTFPEDYDFCGQSARYICGMSVPPIMMANIAEQISKQWFN